MANKEQESGENSVLTEEQRITVLEKSVRLHRWLVLAIWLILIIALSVSITFGIISTTAPDARLFTPQHFHRLQQQVSALSKQNQTQQQTITRLQKQVDVLQHSPGGTRATRLMRDTLIGQERSFQQFIKTMEAGMHDLANMVPGSRTWLEVYTDALDKVMKQGNERVKQLKHDWPENQGVAPASAKSPGPDDQPQTAEGQP